jgi:uncharacterized protein (DUF1778 family)
MELQSYVTQVQAQLEAAAALGDERTQQTAAALATAAGPALRLAVLAALSAAADEITAALLDTPGTPAVAVRLDGEEVRVEVRATATQTTPPTGDDTDMSARISLRLSESLKTDIENAARQESVSVNSWLVRAATAKLNPAWGFGIAGTRFGDFRPTGRGNSQHVTGWINS